MDEHTPSNTTRKTPGPAFFLAALFVYLCLVHGLSLLTTPALLTGVSLVGAAGIPERCVHLLDPIFTLIAQSPRLLQCIAMLVLYGCMIAVFFLTRRIVRGPLWLGSLGAAVFMAHPVKTEVFFSALGLFELIGALLAFLSLLAYLRLIEAPGWGRLAIALMLFALATLPFSANATLFGVLIMLEFFPGTADTRRWGRQVPFLVVALLANGIHLHTLYARMPDIRENLAPLLLFIYPIGLLPATLAEFEVTPVAAWLWALLAAALVLMSMVWVRNGAYRVALLALLSCRFYPDVTPIDMAGMAGGGQLLLPLGLACVALAALCRWLLKFEVWGRPVIALTTMLCIVLFILQFQANRAWQGPLTSPDAGVAPEPLVKGEHGA